MVLIVNMVQQKSILCSINKPSQTILFFSLSLSLWVCIPRHLPPLSLYLSIYPSSYSSFSPCLLIYSNEAFTNKSNFGIR